MSVGFTDRSDLMPATKVDRLKPVTLVLELLRATTLAVHVRDGSGSEAWLARKHITIEDGIRTLRITMPTWLAIEKGLRSDVGAGQGRLL